MDPRSGLAVYVTSHGFGHLNRLVAVLNRLPFDLPVTIRCSPDLFAPWNERLRRPAALEPYLGEGGAVNPPGQSAVTDGPATIDRAMSVHAEATGRIDQEAARLRDGRCAAVLTDIPAVPLVAAARAGVPAFALGNFTWAEIYQEHAEPLGPRARAFVAELRECYGHATAAFRCEPALPMREFPTRIDVGLVVSPGNDRREELRQRLGIPASDRLAYFYVGRYGQDDLDWPRLSRFRGVHFVGFHPAPVGPMPNLHVVPADEWTGADLMASADVAIAKAGYGTVCEAMVSATPLVYPPRQGFAEHRVLDEALRAWGGGLPISVEQFTALDLEGPLQRAFRARPGSPPFLTGGAAQVARHLERACRPAAAVAEEASP
jgi:hypothetical protein